MNDCDYPLRPCPFCGGEAHLNTEYWKADGRHQFAVECSDCGGKCITGASFNCELLLDSVRIMWNSRVENEYEN